MAPAGVIRGRHFAAGPLVRAPGLDNRETTGSHRRAVCLTLPLAMLPDGRLAPRDAAGDVQRRRKTRHNRHNQAVMIDLPQSRLLQ